MALVDTITISTFRDYFNKSNQYNNVFSYKGLECLYNYLWDLSEDVGENIEMDYVAFCCEYTEYNNIKEFQDDYGTDYKTIEDIEEQTTVIRIDDESFIIQQF